MSMLRKNPSWFQRVLRRLMGISATPLPSSCEPLHFNIIASGCQNSSVRIPIQRGKKVLTVVRKICGPRVCCDVDRVNISYCFWIWHQQMEIIASITMAIMLQMALQRRKSPGRSWQELGQRIMKSKTWRCLEHLKLRERLQLQV